MTLGRGTWRLGAIATIFGLGVRQHRNPRGVPDGPPWVATGAGVCLPFLGSDGGARGVWRKTSGCWQRRSWTGAYDRALSPGRPLSDGAGRPPTRDGTGLTRRGREHGASSWPLILTGIPISLAIIFDWRLGFFVVAGLSAVLAVFLARAHLPVTARAKCFRPKKWPNRLRRTAVRGYG